MSKGMTSKERKEFNEVKRVVDELKKMFGIKDKKIISVFYLLEIIQKQEQSNIELGNDLNTCRAENETYKEFLNKYKDLPKKYEEFKKKKAEKKLKAPNVGAPAANSDEQQETPT